MTMSELEKAARQALAALEVSTDWDVNATGKQAQSMRAITALRAALEEQPAEQQEPVAWRYNGKLHEFDPSDWATGPVTPLYTSPPAKPWVGLTDEEIAVIAAACGGLASDFVVDVARAIEQAHGITGETK
jgi:hypothetical protein